MIYNFLLLLVPVGVILLMVGTKLWKQTIIAMLIWALFEGAVRKWVFPQYQAPILLLKDVGFAAAYIGYMLTPKTKIPEADRIRLMVLLFGFLTVYCVLEILNPALPTPLMALYGLKNYLMYIPLVFVIPEMCRTREDVNKVLFWICVIAIPLCLLGLYQFTQPGTAWINKYVSHEAGQEVVASLFGEQGEGEFKYGRARTSSTFSYIGGFTTFLIMVMPLAGGLLLAQTGKRKEMLLAGAALFFAVGATFTTGSRTPVVVVAIAAPLMIIVAGGKGLLPLGAAMRLAAGAALAGAISYFVFAEAAEALIYRSENADNMGDRFFSPISESVGAFLTSPVFGYGVGSNSNAAPTLGGSDLYWLNGNYFELEPARVMQDLGLGGFALVYFIKFYLIFLIVKYVTWSRSKMFIALHMAVLAFIVPHVILFTINNPTGGVIYWALIGFSVAIHRIERRERVTLHIDDGAPTESPRPDRSQLPPPQAATA